MNHYDAQLEFELYCSGALGQPKSDLLVAHLDSCPICTEALREFRALNELECELSSQLFQLPEDFSTQVMSRLPDKDEAVQTLSEKLVSTARPRRSQRWWWLVLPLVPLTLMQIDLFSLYGSELLLLLLFVIGPIFLAFAGAVYLCRQFRTIYSLTCRSYSLQDACATNISWKTFGSISLVLLVFPALWRSFLTAAPGGAPRDFLGILFQEVEGLLGAVFMLGFFLATIIVLFLPFRLQGRKLANVGGFLSLSILFFVFRSTVSLFFGADYSAYEAEQGGYQTSNGAAGGAAGSAGGNYDGGGPTSSFSEAEFDDTLIRSSALPSLQLFQRLQNAAKEALSAEEQISTFSIDVDTGSYTYVRALLNAGSLPKPEDVRVEEFLNYFSYAYPKPESKMFAVSYELARSPFDSSKHILRVGLKARENSSTSPAGRGFVFLIDVSGSMTEPNKLPLLQQSMDALVDSLGPNDRVAIVTYASGSQVVLPSTSGDNKDLIRRALKALRAEGGTNGSEGIRTAYQIAAENLIPDGNNRVILATDGDFNQGISDPSGLIALIEEERKKGIQLTTLGFGITDYRGANLEQLADHGNGNYFYIDSLAEAKKVLVTDISANTEVVAADTKIQVEFNPAFVKSAVLLGYENRKLATEEFRNDSVDAGEVGSGQAVTALYETELTEAGKSLPDAISSEPQVSEYGYLRIRYKSPLNRETSFPREEEFPIQRKLLTAGSPSDDMNFTMAVAEFAKLLKNSPGLYQPEQIRRIAEEALSKESTGPRTDFIELVKKYQQISREPGRAG